MSTEHVDNLVSLIRSRGDSISIRQLQRSSRLYSQSRDKARDALDSLVSAGLATWEPDGKTIRLVEPNSTQTCVPLTIDGSPVANNHENRSEKGNVTSPGSSATSDTPAVADEPTRDRWGRYVTWPKPVPADEKPEIPRELQTLGKYPREWGRLPGNASLQSELLWVQANRIDVCKSGKVRLQDANSPPPSMGALAWLDTSIRSYAKFVEVCARSLATAQDEQDSVRRERMAMAEIDGLLSSA